MTIKYTGTFKKHFAKRIKPHSNLVIRFSERVNLFQNLPKNPILKDHILRGKKSEQRAFWVTGDIRVVYIRVSEDYVTFLDIGTHNQVY